MTWRDAYDLLKAAVASAAPVVAHGLPVLDGVQAAPTIERLAESYEATFAAAPFSVLIEHPQASRVDEVGGPRGQVFLANAFSVIVVENPRQRDEADLDPLTIPYEIATAALQAGRGAGGQGFTANQEFYRYAGDSRGFLFHRFTFLSLTSLPAGGASPSPQPVNLPTT